MKSAERAKVRANIVTIETREQIYLDGQLWPKGIRMETTLGRAEELYMAGSVFIVGLDAKR